MIPAGHLADLGPWVGRSEAYLDEPNDVATGIDLPYQLPVAPDRSELERWPTAGPPTGCAKSALWMQAPDEGDGRVHGTRLPSADRHLESSHLAGDGSVIRALPEQPRERRHGPGRDQQSDDGHHQRHCGAEDVEDGRDRDGHRGTLGRWDRRSTRERARLSCAGPAFAE